MESLFWKSGIRLAASLLLLAAPAAGQAPRDVDQLKAFYRQKCVSCHGGDGSAVAADGRKLRGLDFTDPRAMRGRDDSAMARTIRKGLFFGLRMPGFKKELSEEEARLMVAEVVRKAEKGKAI